MRLFLAICHNILFCTLYMRNYWQGLFSHLYASSPPINVKIKFSHLQYYVNEVTIHVKLPDFQWGRISPPPLHSSQGGRFCKLQIIYIISSFINRSINDNKSFDKAFLYLLSTIIIVGDNCRSCCLWSFWANRYRSIGLGQAITAVKTHDFVFESEIVSKFGEIWRRDWTSQISSDLTGMVTGVQLPARDWSGISWQHYWPLSNF